MARIRTIKPEFWVSEQVNSCSHGARLTFIGLWNFCDDAGVHPAKPKTLKAKVFPMDDDVTVSQMTAWVDELKDAHLLVEYQFPEDGEVYWHVTGWDRHQRIERPSLKYPQPPERTSNRTQKCADTSTSAHRTVGEDSTIAHRMVGEDSTSDHRVVVEDSTSARRLMAEDSQKGRRTPAPGVEWSGEEGKGEKLSAEAFALASASEPAVGDMAHLVCMPQAASHKQGRGSLESSEFTRFWAAYPKKDGKQVAAKAFKSLKPSSELLDRMLAAVEQQSRSEQWTKEGGKYIPMPGTWINQRRWEDQGTTLPEQRPESSDLDRTRRLLEEQEELKRRAVPPPQKLRRQPAGALP